MQHRARFRWIVWTLSFSLFAGGCGGRAIGKLTARDAIIQFPADVLTAEDVEVLSITQVGSSEAVVQTNLRAAFRLQRVGRDWMVREVRIGEGDWEKLDNLLLALRRAKAEDTQSRLERIALAVAAYKKQNGMIPSFKNFVELTDALYPLFLSPLIRFDAWNRPLAAYLLGASSIRIVSAGPDGTMGTQDDIVLTRDFSSSDRFSGRNSTTGSARSGR
jgi:hypothetical protein